MAQIDFLAFAGDPAANVMPQADYAAAGFTPRIVGFAAGTALSPQLNKVWRQASLIAAMIAQFASTETGDDVLDDGSTSGQSALLSTFTNAVRNVAISGLPSNYLPLAGGTLTGPLTISAGGTPQLTIAAPPTAASQMMMVRNAGRAAYLQANSSSSATVGTRWQVILATVDAESGGNAGSNFSITRFSDSGVLLDQPLTINRATGVVNFQRTPTVAGGSFPFLPLAGGTLLGELTVAGGGVLYSGVPSGTHHFAFGWTGSALQSYVDGTSIGLLATQAYVASIAGAYLPLAGGTVTGTLTVNGAVTVVGGAMFRSSVAFANIADFANYTDGTWRWRQWGTGWADGLRASDGYRIWSTPTGNAMTLSAGGALTAAYVQANNGFDGAALNFTSAGSQASVFGVNDAGAFRMVGVYPNFHQLGVKSYGNLLSYNTPTHADGGGAWSCDINGQTVQAGACFATSYPGPSDASIKEGIEPWSKGLAEVMRINPVSYRFTAAAKLGAPGDTHYGVTAQDVQAVLPEAVREIRTNANRDILAVESSTILWASVNAIKELARRVSALEGRP